MAKNKITKFFTFDNKTKILLCFVGGLLVSGTVFYHIIEGRSIFDSFYFSTVTLATIGYGDMAPQTVAGKIFTIIFVFLGLGTFARFALHFSRKETWKIYKKKKVILKKS